MIKTNVVRSLASPAVSRMVAPRLMSDFASIFMLHRFSGNRNLDGHSPHFLRECLETLRRRKTFIVSLEEILRRAHAGEPINGAVAFTMDDGFLDQAEVGAEIFLQFDVPVTCFLITGFQDGVLWPWDDRLAYLYEQTDRKRIELECVGITLKQDLGTPDEKRNSLRLTREAFKKLSYSKLEPALESLADYLGVATDPSRPPERFRAMGWDVARALESRGVRFGPHTISHGIVSRMSDAEARTELLGAWRRVNEELHDPVRIYGWPTGRSCDFSTRDISILRDAGFLGAVATDDDYAHCSRRNNLDAFYQLRRFAMPSTTEDFLQYATWIERAKQRLRTLGGRTQVAP